MLMVNMASAVDMFDLDRTITRNDAVDHTVVAASRRVQAGQLVAQWFTEAIRVACERSEDEFEACSGHFLG